MAAADHPLFRAYPLTGTAEISVGSVPVPYHTYDGQGLLIGGFADLAGVRDLLRAESVAPIETSAGAAVMAIWVVDFTAASLGPHNELQISILVAHRPVAPVAHHPFTLLKALFVNPDARMFAYRIWNNSATAVAYNRELLGLAAQLNHGTITQAAGQKAFHFEDEAGELLCAGRAAVAARPAPRAGWSLLRLLGLRQTLRAFSEPYLGAKVVNPVGAVLPHNADAQSFVAADRPVVQFFDPATDRVELGPALAGQLQFQPQFVEHFAPFRFVYLAPEKP